VIIRDPCEMLKGYALHKLSEAISIGRANGVINGVPLIENDAFVVDLPAEGLGSDVIRQQEAVVYSSIAVLDLRQPRQTSVSGSFVSRYSAPQTLDLKVVGKVHRINSNAVPLFGSSTAVSSRVRLIESK
jgi:hypothetical protein